MKPPSWVLDTNVVVSGLLVAVGFSGRLLDAVLSGRLRLAYDDRVEAEYRDVLARPRLAISPERREAFLAELQNQDAVVAEPCPTECRPIWTTSLSWKSPGRFLRGFWSRAT